MADKYGNKTGGRTKGTRNRVDAALRAQFEMFLREASEDILDLFRRLKEDNPKQALDAIRDYAEFVLPKLSRAEVKHEGEITLNKMLADLDEPIIETRDGETTRH